MNGLSIFYTDTVSVETYQGDSAYGDTFASPVNAVGYLDDSTHLAIGADGQQVISQSVFYTDPSNAALFTADSRVTANGRVSRVITVNNYGSGPVILPQHVEVHLT